MDEHILICIFVFLTGACIGSFLNVVALRALSKESIVLPPSKCPKCNTPIKWYDNIPILSYFLTFRGKCRSCGEKVSIQYPIVETLTALIFLAVFLAFGISLKTLLLLIILCTSIVIIITDIKEEAIFDVHSWILIISAIVFSSLDKNISFALIGCIIGAIFMEIVARASYFLVKKEDNEGQEGYEIDKILYYIVTIFTAVSLFIVFLYFGISLRTFLASLLILSAMIISIISVKKEYVISCFAILLLSAVLSLSVLLKNITNYPIVAVTLIATPLVMKLITVFYNYLIKKLGCRINDSEEIPDRESYDNEINEYVKENKRAFGEGDTYIAAASGALLCINFIFAFFLAVLFGTMLIIFKLIQDEFIKISGFTKSLDFDMEIWHWGSTFINYAPTTYFYLLPDGESNRHAEDSKAIAKIAKHKNDLVPNWPDEDGYIEGEYMDVQLSSGLEKSQTIADMHWSNEAQFFWGGEHKAGDYVNLGFEVKKEGEYILDMNITNAPDYGCFDLYLNDKLLKSNLNCYSSTPTTNLYNFGKVRLRSGDNTFRFVQKTKNISATNNYLGIDFIRIRKL